MNREELIRQLEQVGFNRDIRIPEEIWSSVIEEMHPTDLSLASVIGKDEPSFRDGESNLSLHLKDCTGVDAEEKYIAELERYNPEKHPVRHLLVDFPLWLWRNRIRPDRKGLELF